MQVHRTGPLTWAQHMFWFYNDPYFMEDWGTEPRMARRLRLPRRTPMANLEAALAASVERHEALRTVYERPGREAPKQLVLAAHRPAVTIGSLDAVEPVSIFERPSFRCQVEVDGSTVSSALLVANLIDLDGASLAMIAREVQAFLASGGQTGDGDTGCTIQPIDLAALEGTADSGAESRGRRAMQYFQKAREHAPRNFLPSLSWKHGSGRTRSVTLLDGTAMEAAASIAERCRISVPSVFHAGICKVVSDWTRAPRFLFSTAVANRWGRNVREYIGRLAVGVDCQFELAPDDTYHSVLRRTHKSLFNAYHFSGRDFGAGAMEDARANETAGSVLAKPVLIEYLDYLGDAEVGWPTDGQYVHSMVEETRNDHLWFNISPYRNMTILNVNSDAAMLSEADGAEMLRQVVGFIRDAAEALERPVQYPGDHAEPWGREPETRWLELGISRFSANRIEASIECCEDVSAAAVFTSGIDSLVAYVAGPKADLVEIHERLLVESSHDPLMKMPSLYLLVDEPPTHAKREPFWKETPVIDRFSPADDYPVRVIVDERFEILKQAFIACNGPANVEAAKSYGALGGHYLKISGMMELLRVSGYTGLDPGDFLGLGSMASLAKQMRRSAPVPEDARPQ